MRGAQGWVGREEKSQPEGTDSGADLCSDAGAGAGADVGAVQEQVHVLRQPVG